MPAITDDLEAVFQPTDAPSCGDILESSEKIGLKQVPTRVHNLIPRPSNIPPPDKV